MWTIGEAGVDAAAAVVGRLWAYFSLSGPFRWRTVRRRNRLTHMAAVPAPTSTALQELPRLRQEIDWLSGLLEQVIQELEGAETLQELDRLRRLARNSRAGEREAAEQLAAAVRELSPSEAYSQAMAFALYFELVNLAEENFRVLLLRRRRAEQVRALREGREPAPVRESIEAAVLQLKEQGVSTEAMQALVNQLDIELVFTAHPTESKRRTLLAKLQRLAGLLRHRWNTDAVGPEDADEGAVARELVSLWMTDRSRVARPLVTDEARTGLWYFDSTLYEVLPRLQADLDRALRRHYPDVRAPRRWLRFGSWIGGDRDGNPNVTAAVTAEVLVLHRRLALDKLRIVARDLSRSITVSDRRDRISPEVRQLARESRHFSAHVEQLLHRYPHETYRLLLGVLRERLEHAVGEAGEAATLAYEGPPGREPLTAETVHTTYAVIDSSLRASRSAALAEGDLKRAADQLAVFGLHTARLDLRQHSEPHQAAVAEALARHDYARLPEATKCELLAAALVTAKPLSAAGIAEFSGATRHVLEPLRLAAQASSRFGPEALGIYVISMTNDVSDLLEVQFLMRLTGANLPIAPLFETFDDLARAPQILRELFSSPVYASQLERHHRHQHIMLGYSDSNKDCGYVTANWALYQAQDEIAAVAREHNVRITLFHGRGGSVARGGGPAAKAILAQPVGLRHGSIRVTEQGEVLSTRYHDPDLAHRILEQMTYGVLLGSQAAQAQQSIPTPWREAMDTMSRASFDAYRALVHDDPDFLRFWKQATPIDEIGHLKIGSRPTYRKATQSVADLRAIPWVFSWMQSRFNFPGWYGLGRGLEAVLNASGEGESRLREMYAQWPFFETMIDNAQLTMRKADMGIARLYSTLVEDVAVRERVLAVLVDEFERTERMILRVTGQTQLLEAEPVLRKSVETRNPYIDPLNFLQVEMLRRLRQGGLSTADEEATRRVVELSINGISGGLKNTG